MVDREKITEKIRKAFGTKVPMGAKDGLVAWMRGSDSIVLRYEWIKFPEFYEWLNLKEIPFFDGEDALTIQLEK